MQILEIFKLMSIIVWIIDAFLSTKKTKTKTLLLCLKVDNVIILYVHEQQKIKKKITI